MALTVGVFLLLFGAGLWAFTRMGHRFAMVERGVGLVKKKRRIAFSVFFFNDTATTEIYTLSLHDALPIFIIFLPVITHVHIIFGIYRYQVVVSGKMLFIYEPATLH